MAKANGSTKWCPKCQETKDVSEFGTDSKQSDGLRVWCQECRRQSARDYGKRNQPKVRQNQKRWLAQNAEHRRAWRKAYYAKTKAKHAAQIKARRALNPEKFKEYSARADAKRDPVKRRAGVKRRRDQNPELTRERSRRAYSKNPVPAKNARDRRRIALRAAGEYKSQDIDAIRDSQRNRCAYCRVFLGRRYHIDHIVPLASGGSNYPKNLQLTCGPCNLKKKAQDPLVFARKLGKLL